MMTVTLAKALSGRADISLDVFDRSAVYVVRDNDLVLYVGITRGSLCDRLLGHCGRGEFGWASGVDSLGVVIQDNHPSSMSWLVDIYTERDCVEDLRRFGPNYNLHWLENAEIMLIERLRPCLNVVHNRGNRTPLPEKYIKYKIANDGMDVSDDSQDEDEQE